MAVTPEDLRESQPLVSPRTGCVIVADVRLDNRFDLLACLPEDPDPHMGDAELILRAYEAQDVDALPHLLGDFAFILWDPRRQRLICARDTSGQRTLFYRADPTRFVAASEIHQLFQDPNVSIQPNVDYMRERLTPLNMFRNEKDSASTYFDGIFAVPAGHYALVDGNGVQVKRYWRFQPPTELRYRRDEEYAEHFLDLFSRVVAARLRVAGPIGALLSGGLDSSSIICTAQQAYQKGEVENRGFTTFSSIYGDLECDEELFIRDMQREYGFDAQYIPSREAGGYLVTAQSGFVESPNMGSRDLRDGICDLAAQEGVRVLLSGEQADNCVGGARAVFDSLLRKGNLRLFRKHFQAYRRVTQEPLLSTLAFGCVIPLLPLSLERRIHRAYIRRKYAQEQRLWLPSWMPESLRMDLSRRQLALWTQLEDGRVFGNPARHQEYNLITPPEIARHPAPWPIEIWRPFADRRLHEFLLAIPPEQKFEPHPETDDFYAGSKQVVRRAMRGIVPEGVRTRTYKTVFDDQFRHQLRVHWGMYRDAFGPGSCSEVDEHGFVDRDLFWARLSMYHDGHSGADQPYILHILGLENWLRSLRQPRSQLITVPLGAATQYSHANDSIEWVNSVVPL
jgi:asparagine synthase (glutamine-hydrolysing)